MPIVASRGSEIRRLLGELSDPRRRAGAILRLRTLGARVVPHAAEELGRLDAAARGGLLEALSDLNTNDAKSLRKRLVRAETPSSKASSKAAHVSALPADSGIESLALQALRALPLPMASERPSITRERGEAHLVLARAGSRLARKDLLHGLAALPSERTHLYCEAAGLIGDASFLEILARIGSTREEGVAAIALITSREKITARSKAVRNLDPALRNVVARALVGF